MAFKVLFFCKRNFCPVKITQLFALVQPSAMHNSGQKLHKTGWGRGGEGGVLVGTERGWAEKVVRGWVWGGGRRGRLG